MEQIHSQRQWYEIKDAEFGFLTPQEIRKMSCKEITNPQVYDKSDKNKVATLQGLYDPCLGVSPNEKYSTCATCGKTGLECSGHSGHIELLLPTYNPIVVDQLLKLLRMHCFNCHRLRMKPKIKEDYRVVLTLAKKGYVKEAFDYIEIDMTSELRKMENMKEKQVKIRESKELRKERKDKEKETEKRTQEKAIESKLKKDISNQMKKLNEIEKKRQSILELVEHSGRMDSTESSIMAFSMLLKGFYAMAQQQCPYCKKQCKIVKKEGASKFFVINRASKKDKDEKTDRKKSKESSSKAGDSTHHPGQSEGTEKQQKSKKRYVTPREITSEMRKLWGMERSLFDIIFGNLEAENNYTMFFHNVIFVPPSRFRPESVMNEQKYLHDHTLILSKILQTNIDLKLMIIYEHMVEVVEKQGEKDKKAKLAELKLMSTYDIKNASWFSGTLRRLKGKSDFINKWLELQDNANCFMDATRSSKASDKEFKGIRQILEKKEGLFRMKMMGKRVNFAARSVISPDPSLNTDEVGLPEFMAKKLTFPENVNEYNIKMLQECIINGKKYPGATQISENGISTKIDHMSLQQRTSLARNLLLNHENKIVLRHVMTGDNVLFNRQPTLHKPGLMAHRVKVLPRESTLRMNYANCKSYNADFDGDEMNLHVIQNYMCKAEAELCISDTIYNNPTNGKPIREIMQDSVIAAVYLTMKDTFLNKKDYSQLLYQSTISLLDHKPSNTRLFLIQPAILKPQRLWTGKQLFSNIVKMIVELSDLKFRHKKGLTMKSTTKIGAAYLEGFQEESEVVMIDNELVKGIIDKNQVGSGAEYGIVHSFNELYGEKLTGRLLTCLTKLFLNFMQMHGFTCGIDDLVLKKKNNKSRREMLDQALKHTVNEVCQVFSVKTPEGIDYVGRSLFKCDEEGQPIEENKQIHIDSGEEILGVIEKKITSDPLATQKLDEEYKHHLTDKCSDIVNEALAGFIKKFPRNNFSMMTVTGAKGSNVNHSQVAVMLGQQELEGKRVPLMISGKTLPSFIAYDPNPRASGFISDRFLTGLRQQEFYFHCMAGREGLIDTAVKTSRSGYLQRCLMKHLESLKVEYDYTVRDADGSIIQFLYGEDSLDPTKQKFFSKMDFLQNNFEAFKEKYKYKQFKKDLKTAEIFDFKSQSAKKNQTILEQFRPGPNVGTISDKCFDLLRGKRQFNEVYSLKYMFSMVQPGESVGCTAAQSIGQPSTQMTLNTFHLAGHGGVNLTLGIPRLRELLMTSSDKIKTPIMEMFFKEEISRVQAERYSKQLEKIRLSQLIQKVHVEEWKQLFIKDKLMGHHDRKRYYRITLTYEREEFVTKEFGLTYGDIRSRIENEVVCNLLSHINRVKKKNELRAEIKKLGEKQAKERELEEYDEEKEEKAQKEEFEDVEEGEDGEKDLGALIQAVRKKEKQREKKDNDEKEKEDREKVRRYDSPYFQSMDFTADGCQIVVKVALKMKKFLMTKVIEKLLRVTIVREIQGINSAIVMEKKNGESYIQTAGVNFSILRELDFIDRSSVKSNDIQAINRNFGIEAARSAIINEIVNLFGAYGVTVDYRHLYLIGDYITFLGRVKAMNRLWIANSASPFQRMSFETSNKFITNAAMHCEMDPCKTPSSRIILGQRPLLGTNMCDLLMDFQI